MLNPFILKYKAYAAVVLAPSESEARQIFAKLFRQSARFEPKRGLVDCQEGFEFGLPQAVYCLTCKGSGNDGSGKCVTCGKKGWFESPEWVKELPDYPGALKELDQSHAILFDRPKPELGFKFDMSKLGKRETDE